MGCSWTARTARASTRHPWSWLLRVFAVEVSVGAFGALRLDNTIAGTRGERGPVAHRSEPKETRGGPTRGIAPRAEPLVARS